MFISGAGYKAIATTLTSEGILCPSAYDRARNPHRSGHEWSFSAVRAIIANPRYTGRQVWGRQPRHEVLLDPESPQDGYATIQRWAARSAWVESAELAHDPLVDEPTWQLAESIVSAGVRSAASGGGRPHQGSRRSESSRYALAGLVACDACGRSTQGNTVRNLAFYRCRPDSSYAVPLAHSGTYSVRDDGMLPKVDAWLTEVLSPANLEATARDIVDADGAGSRDDPAIARARKDLLDAKRRVARHLDGLEAGIPAEVISARIAATRLEIEAAERLIATTPTSPAMLDFDDVLAVLAELRDLPELLATIDTNERNTLYRTLGLKVSYRRRGESEAVQLSGTFSAERGPQACRRGDLNPHALSGTSPSS